jgi:hypothetical protein
VPRFTLAIAFLLRGDHAKRHSPGCADFAPEIWRKSFGETDGHDGVERLHGVLRYLLRCAPKGKRSNLAAINQNSVSIDRSHWPAGPPWRITRCLAQNQNPKLNLKST